MLIAFALTLSALLLAGPLPPKPKRTLFIEFNGICDLVPNPDAPGRWIAVFPRLDGIKSVNGKSMHDHIAYLKFWHGDDVVKADGIRCEVVSTMKVCDLTGDPVKITLRKTEPEKNVGRSQTFDDDVASIYDVSGEQRLYDLRDLRSRRIQSRVYINWGDLIGVVNPLVRWDFGDGRGPRPVARAVLWEVDADTTKPDDLVYIDGVRSNGDKWSIALKFTKGTVISMAQTDEDEREVDNYYLYMPPQSDQDEHFLLHYTLVEDWTDNGGDVTAKCLGDSVKCRYPNLDTSAGEPSSGAVHPMGRKTNCFIAKFPVQQSPTPTPAPPAKKRG